MEEMNRNEMQTEQNVPWQPYESQPTVPALPKEPVKPAFPTRKAELIFGLLTVLFSMLLCNSLLYAGPNLGFAAGVAGCLVSGFFYLRSRGHRPDRYAAAVWGLCILIVAAFPRSSDVALKALMILLLMLVPNLALCLMAGMNRRSPDGFLSLLDSPETLIFLGFGQMSQAGRGIRNAFRRSGELGKKGGSVALGLLIAVPLLAVMIPLLLSADAAFEGLLDLLPDFKWEQALTTLILGAPLGYLIYTCTTALHHVPKAEKAAKARKGLASLTVNTVLVAVALVYGAYLVSQLAYFVGGFSGILPEGFTMAQYARRGFFEMAWLCAMNLGIISLSVGLVRSDGRAPLSTRLICLFLGLVTLFLVAAASAKMFLYIGSYGLTRLRVLTEVFMLWLVLTTVFVCIWLFRPKTPYMKPVVLTGLLLCAGLMWADVDARIACYNVRAYQSGKLETVDVAHLSGLSDGAVPYIYELVGDSDPEIARQASECLMCWELRSEDLRSWNYAAGKAEAVLDQFMMEQIAEELGLMLQGELEVFKNTYNPYSSFGEYAVVISLSQEPVLSEAWQEMPLPTNLQYILYGPQGNGGTKGPYFVVDSQRAVPQVENGAWWFCDRYPNAEDPGSPEKVLSRADMNFTLAVYDRDAGKLYFFMKDY